MLDIKLSGLLGLQFGILNKITVGAAHLPSSFVGVFMYSFKYSAMV